MGSTCPLSLAVQISAVHNFGSFSGLATQAEMYILALGCDYHILSPQIISYTNPFMMGIEGTALKKKFHQTRFLGWFNQVENAGPFQHQRGCSPFWACTREHVLLPAGACQSEGFTAGSVPCSTHLQPLRITAGSTCSNCQLNALFEEGSLNHQVKFLVLFKIWMYP